MRESVTLHRLHSGKVAWVQGSTQCGVCMFPSAALKMVQWKH